MGHVREGIIAATNKIPWVKPPLRFIERAAYFRRCYCICKWDTSLPEQAEAELQRSGYIARIGSEADLDKLAHTETWRSCALYKRWLSAGKQILLLEKDSKIMSYVWLDFNPEFAVEQVPEIRFRLSPDTYYSDEAYTPVAYRGLGLRRLSFIAELLFAQRQGYQFMVSYFLDDSALANGIRNFTRTGNSMGKIIKEVHLLKIAGIRFSWLKDLTGDESIVRVQ